MKISKTFIAVCIMQYLFFSFGLHSDDSAFFGLSFGMSAEQVKARGVILSEEKTSSTGYGTFWSAKNLPKHLGVLENGEITLYFGNQANKLFRVIWIGKPFKSRASTAEFYNGPAAIEEFEKLQVFVETQIKCGKHKFGSGWATYLKDDIAFSILICDREQLTSLGQGEISCTEDEVCLALVVRSSQYKSSFLASEADVFKSFDLGTEEDALAALKKKPQWAELKDDVDRTPIHWAASKNFSRALEWILQKNCDLDVLDKNKRSPLHHAVANGSYDCVQILLKKGANTKNKDEQGKNLLHTALEESFREKSSEVIDLLIKAGVNVNEPDSYRRTPLMTAAFFTPPVNREKITDQLLAGGAEWDIFSAAAFGRTDVVEKLLREYPDLLLSEYADGSNPITWSVVLSKIDTVKCFLSYGADPEKTDSIGMSPLFYAIKYASEPMVELLLQSGRGINSKNSDGLTLLHQAMEIKDDADCLIVIKWLIDHGADVNLSDGHDLVLRLLIAIKERERGYADKIMHLLLEKCVNLHFFAAVMSGDFESAKGLLNQDPEIINRQTPRGVTPLMFAVAASNMDMVKWLISHGARVNDLLKPEIDGKEDGRGGTVLDISADKSDWEMFRFLLAQGADCTDIKREVNLIAEAIRCGEFDIARELIAKGCPVNKDEGRALEEAVKIGSKEMVELLFSAGAEIKQTSGYEQGEIFVSASQSKEPNSMLKLLVTNGGDINSGNGWPLLSSIYCLSCTRALLEAGADPNPDTASTLYLPLSLAALKNQIETCRLLIDHGADVNGGYRDMSSPFLAVMNAASNNKDKIVNWAFINLLFEKGADPNKVYKWGITPLHGAVWSKSEPAIRFLLEKGADPNAKLDDPPVRHDQGATPLHLISEDQSQLVAYFAAKGAKLDSEDKDGMTPLARAVWRSDRKLIEALLKSGAKSGIHVDAALGRIPELKKHLSIDREQINCRNARGETPLHWVAHAGDLATLAFIISQGADVNALDAKLNTPLVLATKQGNLSKIELLLKSGASPKAANLLHIAIGARNSTLVRLLLAAGAEVDFKDRDGWTPLHHAVNIAELELIELLVTAGAPVNARDDKGLTPLHIAFFANKGCQDYLISHGADIHARDYLGRSVFNQLIDGVFSRLEESGNGELRQLIRQAPELSKIFPRSEISFLDETTITPITPLKYGVVFLPEAMKGLEYKRDLDVLAFLASLKSTGSAYHKEVWDYIDILKELEKKAGAIHSHGLSGEKKERDNLLKECFKDFEKTLIAPVEAIRSRTIELLQKIYLNPMMMSAVQAWMRQIMKTDQGDLKTMLVFFLINLPGDNARVQDNFIKSTIMGALQDTSFKVRLLALDTIKKWPISVDAVIPCLMALRDPNTLIKDRARNILLTFEQEVLRLLISEKDLLTLLPMSGTGFEAAWINYWLGIHFRESGNLPQSLRFAKAAEKELGNIENEDEEALMLLAKIKWLRYYSILKQGIAEDLLSDAIDLDRRLDLIPPHRQQRAKFPYSITQIFWLAEIFIGLGENSQAEMKLKIGLDRIEKERRNIDDDCVDGRIYRTDLEQFSSELVNAEKMICGRLGQVMSQVAAQFTENSIKISQKWESRDIVELNNEEATYLLFVRQKIAEGDVEGAQRMTEELQLRKLRFYNSRKSIRLGDGEKQEKIDELLHRESEIKSLKRQLSALGPGQSDPTSGIESDTQSKKRELQEKERELNRYLVKIKKEHPEISALVKANPIEFKEIESRLSEKSLILQYVVMPDKISIFLLGKNTMEVTESDLSGNDLRQRVRNTLSAIKGRSPEVNSDLVWFYQKLIAPVEERLAGKDHIYFVLDRELFYLPFAAFVDSQGRYLVERFSMSFLTSVSYLWVAMQRQQEGNGFFAVANPDGTLPGAEKEVRSIRKLLGVSNELDRFYFGQEAKIDVMKDARLKQFMHISSHGYLRDAWNSSIKMADGEMSLDEVWGLDLRGVKMAVLSSCETGVGELLSNGADMINLGNAFIYAGARGVIASLWRISDEATNPMMSKYYGFQKEFVSPARALQKAQLSMINGDMKSEYAQPYYWAAFVLYGIGD
jgi:ankyrin repeat protein/CHAT domain-containing protein